MTQKILKIGNSAIAIIPKEFLKELGLKIGDRVHLHTDTLKRRIVVSKNKIIKKI